MSQNRDKKGQGGLYSNLDNPEDDVITFELAKVPMQDFVSSMRKSAVHAWLDAKALYTKVRDETTKFVSNTRSQTNDKLKSVGITNPALVIKVGTISSAGLFGLFLARKRSTFRRILYPTVTGGSVWAAFYLSSADNRSKTWAKVKDLEQQYISGTVSKYKTRKTNEPSEKSKR